MKTATRRTKQRFGRAARSWVIAAAICAGGVSQARDVLLASAYSPLVDDLMTAFRAVEAQCPVVTYQQDVCFEARPAGASQLAEALTDVAAAYEAAGLRVGEWRAANGVWAVTLAFGPGHGTLEVYLSEVEPGAVRGTFVFHRPR